MTHRTTVANGKTIPTATSTRAAACPDRHVHLFALDDEGEPLCEIVIGLGLFEKIMDAAEESGLLDDYGGDEECRPSSRTN